MSLAIVGAGLSGLAAAFALRDTPMEITVFEKSREVSGRAATRCRNGVRYDYGANHLKAQTKEVQSLVQEELPADGLEKIEGPVWTFDEEGELAEGDPERNEQVRWTYRDGIRRLGTLLAEAAGTAPQLDTHITFLTRDGDRWRLSDTEGGEYGPYEAVLLTPPAPQAIDLLRASRFDDVLQEHLADALAPATYRTQLTLILAYRRRVERPGDCYALLNADGAHDIAWLGFEEDKPGHLPEDDSAPESVLVAQMAPDWSRPRLRSELGALVPETTARIASLLGQELGRPLWADKHAWRYALPEEVADTAALADGADVGLFFAGDGLTGKGRIEQALASGLETGERLRQFFGEGRTGKGERPSK